MTSPERDLQWMRRALRNASRGFTPPNPMVGCVIVKNDRLVGEGFHLAAGLPHAEVNALRQAGDLAAGATAYVTLEPCCHWGRTPPCADALISAGIERVVVAHLDPDPRVSGGGIDLLRRSGIHVDVGPMASEARRLNTHFLHFHLHHLPYTTLKAAMSLDGKTATSTGNSQWITGKRSREYVHKLRARSGAVMAGIGTVLADDPRLTARLTPKSPRQPLRIIVDSHLRTPPDCSAIQASSETAPLLIVTTDGVNFDAAARFEEHEGVEVLRLKARCGRVDLAAMMEILGERQIISVLVEGGAEINAALLAAGAANSVLFFVAPLLIGGRCAPGAIAGDGVPNISDAVRLRDVRIRRFGPDYAIEGAIDKTEILADNR